jgi:hypothetical protein
VKTGCKGEAAGSEGQADCSQARRAVAPKGLEDSAQGFNPGKPANKRFALKGLEADQINLAPVAAQKLECAIGTCTI